MSKDFSDCKKEVLEVLYSCFFYLTTEKLSRELMHKDTKNEDELLQSIEDTVRLFAPELVEESKFTKGKWRVKYNPIIQGIFDEDNKPIQLNEANARLIAAAPEMYEMMKNASNYILECAKLYSPFPDELCMYAERTKELLARIDGEDEWLKN